MATPSLLSRITPAPEYLAAQSPSQQPAKAASSNNAKEGGLNVSRPTSRRGRKRAAEKEQGDVSGQIDHMLDRLRLAKEIKQEDASTPIPIQSTVKAEVTSKIEAAPLFGSVWPLQATTTDATTISAPNTPKQPSPVKKPLNWADSDDEDSFSLDDWGISAEQILARRSPVAESTPLPATSQISPVKAKMAPPAQSRITNQAFSSITTPIQSKPPRELFPVMTSEMKQQAIPTETPTKSSDKTPRPQRTRREDNAAFSRLAKGLLGPNGSPQKRSGSPAPKTAVPFAEKVQESVTPATRREVATPTPPKEDQKTHSPEVETATAPPIMAPEIKEVSAIRTSPVKSGAASSRWAR